MGFLPSLFETGNTLGAHPGHVPCLVRQLRQLNDAADPGFKTYIEVATLKTKGHVEQKIAAEAKAWIIDNREFIMQI